MAAPCCFEVPGSCWHPRAPKSNRIPTRLVSRLETWFRDINAPFNEKTSAESPSALAAERLFGKLCIDCFRIKWGEVGKKRNPTRRHDSNEIRRPETRNPTEIRKKSE